jgi:hypothetical protein
VQQLWTFTLPCGNRRKTRGELPIHHSETRASDEARLRRTLLRNEREIQRVATIINADVRMTRRARKSNSRWLNATRTRDRRHPVPTRTNSPKRLPATQRFYGESIKNLRKTAQILGRASHFGSGWPFPDAPSWQASLVTEIVERRSTVSRKTDVRQPNAAIRKLRQCA